MSVPGGPGWLNDIFDAKLSFEEGSYMLVPDENFEGRKIKSFDGLRCMSGKLVVSPPEGRDVSHRGIVIILKSVVSGGIGSSSEVLLKEWTLMEEGSLAEPVEVNFDIELAELANLRDTFHGAHMSLRHFIGYRIVRPWYTFSVKGEEEILVHGCQPLSTSDPPADHIISIEDCGGAPVPLEWAKLSSPRSCAPAISAGGLRSCAPPHRLSVRLHVLPSARVPGPTAVSARRRLHARSWQVRVLHQRSAGGLHQFLAGVSGPQAHSAHCVHWHTIPLGTQRAHVARTRTALRMRTHRCERAHRRTHGRAGGTLALLHARARCTLAHPPCHSDENARADERRDARFGLADDCRCSHHFGGALAWAHGDVCGRS